jgi:hypothetical protein
VHEEPVEHEDHVVEHDRLERLDRCLARGVGRRPAQRSEGRQLLGDGRLGPVDLVARVVLSAEHRRALSSGALSNTLTRGAAQM